MKEGLEGQLKRVEREMSQRPAGLQRHVDRVMKEALQLARAYDIDPLRTKLAVRGHDLFRAERPKALLRLARDSGLPVSPEDEASPVMLHGPIAAIVLRERFSVTDPEVLDAIAQHTSGAPEMPVLAKVILLADKVEARKRKRAPQLSGIRKLTRRDLDTAMLCWADWKWVEERTRGWPGYPGHWSARLEWVRAHHDEVGLPARRPERKAKDAKRPPKEKPG